MIFTLKVTYAGQEAEFHDLEFDDEILRDETYGPGQEFNNEVVIEDFYENVQLEITKRSEAPDNRDAQERKEDYLADQADNYRKYGKEA